ncbi:MAG: hypothetical protein ACRDMX_12530 [Solirubrobacteraceae bacterium]
MPVFRNHHRYESKFDVAQDRDLVIMINEARNPEQIADLARSARARFRSRRAERLRRCHVPRPSSRPSHASQSARPLSTRF